MKIPGIVIILLSFLSAHGQENIVSGRVLHAGTREPIPFANVFLAGTSIGSVSNGDGRFFFKGFSNGIYDLTVSFVGFETHKATVDFNNVDAYEAEVVLRPQVIQLDEIFIHSESGGWKRNYEVFKKVFLGTTPNARKCRILNAESLYLFLDAETNVLYAHAKEPLVIENRALGYRVTYLLDKFEYHLKPGTVYTFGVPRFDQLDPENKGDEKKWDERRRAALSGSVMHFVRALVRDELSENGFIVKKVFEIQERILPSLQTTSTAVDSLSDDHRWLPPGLIDSTAQEVIGAEALFESGDRKTIRYRGKLEVTYLKEKVESGYRYFHHTYDENQLSKIYFLEEGVKVNADGSFADPKKVFVTGYWGWSEMIAELLPYDYK